MDCRITFIKQTVPVAWKSMVGMLAMFSFGQVAAQDSCGAAVPIGAGTYTVSAINGSPVFSGCQGNNGSVGEWYVYTPNENHTVTITSDLQQNMCGDTHVGVYSGSCEALLCVGEDDDAGVIGCNGGNASYLSVITFNAMQGETYFIVWDDRWNADGFDFQLIEQPYIPTFCDNAVSVNQGVTTVAAMEVPNLMNGCSGGSLAAVYRYTAASNAILTISSDLEANICKDTYFSVYTGNCNVGLSCLTFDDDGGVLACNDGTSKLSKKSFEVQAGQVLYIVWDDLHSAEGFDFSIQEEEIVLPINYVYSSVANVLQGAAYNTCVVDMNGDGLDDLVGVNNGILRVHHQGDSGAFTSQDFTISGFSQMPSWSIAAGDYNKDGYNDLLLGAGQGLSFWRSNATGTAYTVDTPGNYIFCQRTNFIDINNDGNLDAFSCHDIAANCWYINDGNANMSFNQSSGPNQLGSITGNYASIWTDYDNDGDVDMFISKCSGPACELHRNNGDGTFTDVAPISGLNFQPVQSWSSAVADFDNDGDMDILVGANGSAPTRLFRNDLETNPGGDMFTNITLNSGWSTNTTYSRDYISYDFDNDGNMDVLGGGNKIMFGNGDGTFLGIDIPNISMGAIGDLNNDGFLDFYVNGTVRLAQPNGNHWVKLILRGIESNSNGIGARVEAHGPWGVKIRDVRSGEGFEFMSSLNTHFGLGQYDTIESLVIKWPSGVVDVLQNPSVDQSYSVVEGSHPLSTAEVSAVKFSLYPNPANDVLHVKTAAQMASVREIEIFDMLGRLVSTPTLNDNTVSVRSLSQGNYIMVLRTMDGKSYSQKFIKK